MIFEYVIFSIAALFLLMLLYAVIKFTTAYFSKKDAD